MQMPLGSLINKDGPVTPPSPCKVVGVCSDYINTESNIVGQSTMGSTWVLETDLKCKPTCIAFINKSWHGPESHDRLARM